MVIVIIGILAAAAISNANSSVYDQLQAAAKLIAEDVSYARSLAVAYNSNYRLTFDLTQNEYVLQHTGSNAALNPLPRTPSRSPDDPADRQIVRLQEEFGAGVAVKLFAVYALGTPSAAVGQIEFGPLGETTRAEETIIWLTAGSGTSSRYLSIRVSPVTGIGRLGTFQAQAPSVSTSLG